MLLNYNFLFSSFMFGVAITIALGPISIIILNISARVGLKEAFRCAFGAATADLTCAIIAFFLYSSILQYISEHKVLFNNVSNILLIVLGLYISISAFSSDDQKSGVPKNLKVIANNPFISMYFLTMASPMMIPLFTGFIGRIDFTPNVWDKIFGALSLFLGSIVIQIHIAVFARSVQRYLIDSKVLKIINVIAGIAISLFGVKELFF